MSGPNARSAPKGWEAVVADLAEKHADALEVRVKHLRQLADDLRRSSYGYAVIVCELQLNSALGETADAAELW
jgi:hypothetical protein